MLPLFRILRRAGAALVFLAASGSAVNGAPREVARAPGQPALIVMVVIDQFSADYLTRFESQMTGGLARLMKGGAWFDNAHQDHAITETAPGHASLLSGRFPRSTGIMMNSIGVADESTPLLAGGYGPGASPKRYLGNTLVDWLKSADSKSRSLSVSSKDRAAILPFGTIKSEVYWYSPDGRFVTSSYYRKALPDWVNAFNERHVPSTYAGKVWTLLLPDSAYSEPDTVEIEAGRRRKVFPYSVPDDMFDAVNLVRATPFMDDIVATFAIDGIRSLALGTGGRTDIVSMSLSSTDVIGHSFGPDSREMHDQVLRVDGVVGRFLDSLYAMRDSSTITVVLTADHGIARIPELVKDVTPPPVRASVSSALSVVRKEMQAAGVDSFAIATDQAVVLLNRQAFEKSSLKPDTVLAHFTTLALARPGVASVDRYRTLIADSSSNPIARRWAHQFPDNVNVELIVTLKKFSTWGGNVASHGSPYDYDSHVPIIFAGYGVKAGRYTDFVRTVDIAPTLAAIAGTKVDAKIDGVLLIKAVLPSVLHD